MIGISGMGLQFCPNLMNLYALIENLIEIDWNLVIFQRLAVWVFHSVSWSSLKGSLALSFVSGTLHPCNSAFWMYLIHFDTVYTVCVTMFWRSESSLATITLSLPPWLSPDWLRSKAAYKAIGIFLEWVCNCLWGSHQMRIVLAFLGYEIDFDIAFKSSCHLFRRKLFAKFVKMYCTICTTLIKLSLHMFDHRVLYRSPITM